MAIDQVTSVVDRPGTPPPALPKPKLPGVREVADQVVRDLFGKDVQDTATFSYEWTADQTARGKRNPTTAELTWVQSVGQASRLLKRAMLRAQHEYDELAASIARQRAENARLRDQARRLREDPSAIEEIARRELGLIKPGERVFIVKDVGQNKQ